MDCRSRRTTPGAIAWTPSRTADSCRFPREEFFRRFPAICSGDRGPCDYDVRHNLTASYVYELPLKVRGRRSGPWLNGWQVSGSVFWHSGIAVLGPERALFRQWKRHRARQRTAIRQRRSGRAALRAQCDSRRHAAGHDSVAQPECLRFHRRSRAPARAPAATTPQNCQFGNLGRNALRGPDFIWSDLYLTKWFTLSERAEAAHRRPVFQSVQSPELRTAGAGLRRHSRESLHADRFRRADLHDVAAHRSARRRTGRR